MNEQQRKDLIDSMLHSKKKTLEAWAKERNVALRTGLGSILNRELTYWQAQFVLHNYATIDYLLPNDILDTEVEVELTITAKVKVTSQFRYGVMDQNGWSAEDAFNDEKLGAAMVFASLNPTISSWDYNNEVADDYWDGVGNMRGLITGLELDTK